MPCEHLSIPAIPVANPHLPDKFLNQLPRASLRAFFEMVRTEAEIGAHLEVQERGDPLRLVRKKFTASQFYSLTALKKIYRGGGGLIKW